MDPIRLSAALRSVADRIDRSTSPSRSAVASELGRVLAAMSDSTSGSGPEKVVVSESWTRQEAEAVAADVGGTDLREGPYGDIGMVVPAANVAQLTEGGEDVHVFSSWLEASGDDPEYEFTPIV